MMARFLTAVVLAATAAVAQAQMSLQSSVALALKNSPKIRGASADRAKALANVQEIRDVYIPAVTTQGGYGQSTGAPLGVPTVFSIAAQSLGFSFQQKDNMRAARAGLEAADYALQREQSLVVQDITNTYVSLSNAESRQAVLRAELDLATHLSQVVLERVSTGIDARVELPKAHRTATQLRLSALQVESEINGYQQHLALATGVAYANLHTVPDTIPLLTGTVSAEGGVQAAGEDEGILGLVAAARAKQFSAFAEKRYLLRPQVAISAYYSRVYTGSSSYLDYYPCFDGTSGRRGSICYDGSGPQKQNSENAIGAGFQITLPILDYAHRAKARASQAEAVRAAADVDVQRIVVKENRERLRHSTAALELRMDLAREEQEIAEAQLETVRLQLQSSSSSGQGQLLNPKDELGAQLQERQRYFDLLGAQLQLQQAQLNLLQLGGGLSKWIDSTASRGTTVSPVGASPQPLAIPAATGNQTVMPSEQQPGTPGTSPTVVAPGSPIGMPSGNPPVGSTPAPVR